MEMNWSKLLNTHRLRRDPDKKPPELELSPFFEDQDRILFSQPFRRLQAKTQVHPLADNDHVRTRLTHSIEVGTIGYALGSKVGRKIIEKHKIENFDEHDIGLLVQAACFAHDIGNPPFGHIGEQAIREWFVNNSSNILRKIDITEDEIRDLTLFEGNAQGFRILTQIENYKWSGGMQLTYATLATFMKYPWGSDYIKYDWAKQVDPKSKGKYSIFQAEKEYAKEIADNVGLIPRNDFSWYRHPLAYLVEASDDICYALIDLEDGIEMNSFTIKEYIDLFYDKFITRETNKREYDKFDDNVQRISYLRSKAMLAILLQVADAFVENEKKLLDGSFSNSLFDVIKERKFVEKAKKIAAEKVFAHEKKQFVEIAAYEIISGLLDAFIEACIFETKKEKSKKLRKLMGRMNPEDSDSNYQKIMRVVDFIAGMTDRYALGIYRQLKGIAVSSSTPAPNIIS